MKPIKQEKKGFRMIGQGTYGCAYRPSIRCKDQKVGSAHFLSKVQIKDHSSDVELRAGTLIRTISSHQQFFAPILEQCPIQISKLENSELKNCDVIKEGFYAKSPPEYVSSKIRYVGGETMDDYFQKVLQPSATPLLTLQKYWKILGNSHLYLLNSVHILNKAGLLHLDIKENNVMRDRNRKAFIIIDFGLSYEIQYLNLEKYVEHEKKPFGVRVESYIPWPIEMNLLSYIARVVQDQTTSGYGPMKPEIWVKKVENVSELKTVCNLFIKSNALLQDKLFTKEECKDYLERLHKWVEGMRGKTWGEIWDVIVKTHLSWDAYGLSVMYLKELKMTNIVAFLQELPELKKEEPDLQKQAVNTVTQIVTGKNPRETRHTYFMREYVKHLKRHVLSDPETRSHADKLGNELRSLFGKIDRVSYNVMNEQIASQVFDEKNQHKMDKNKKQNTLRELTADKQIRKGFNTI